MQILVIGSGGREHAIAWKAAQSNLVKKVWVAPGNAGTEQEPNVENVPIAPDDIPALVRFAQEKNISLTIVGPEIPLALGIVDAFNDVGLKCFGPTQKAAQLEASKSFCKHFLRENHIPTAAFATFNIEKAALEYLKAQKYPLVIKADGLAAGKGVIIAENEKQAQQAVHAMLSEQRFGDAAKSIVIEEFLSGEELSYIVMVDGKHILPFASSQDHKRRDDGDKGPNTGGMGAYSPAINMSNELNNKILTRIIEPTISALAQKGIPYVGFLYAGLMITHENEPKVLEFNCRLGDPETQPILMRLKSDLVPLCLLALEGKLNQAQAQWDDRAALAVILAAGGYPEKYKKNDVISGLENINTADSKVFHAGTKRMNDKIVTHGGRVLAVTSLGQDIQAAHDKAYQLVEKIHWDNCYYRKDIGHRALIHLTGKI